MSKPGSLEFKLLFFVIFGNKIGGSIFYVLISVYYKFYNIFVALYIIFYTGDDGINIGIFFGVYYYFIFYYIANTESFNFYKTERDCINIYKF